MKTSLIITIYNEQNSIIPFLESVYKQSVFPSEIVIVDAESSDSTVKLIKDFFIKHKKISFTLLQKKGNRSVGRNLAIKNAKYPIILATDAGCTLEKNWIKNILSPFEHKNIAIVSGFYKPITKNVFQKALSTYTCVMPDHVDPNNFLPSTRSVAFKKSAWKNVNGFPEYLDTCEDMIFDKKLKEKRFTFYFEKKAIVYWPQRENIWQAFLQFFKYAKGDGKAHYFRSQTPLLFLRYIAGFILLIIVITSHSAFLLSFLLALLSFYLLWSAMKNYKYVNDWKAVIILPALQITADIAVLMGTTIGIIQSA